MHYPAKINNSLAASLFLFVIICFIPYLSKSQKLKIITYNIRYDNPNDGESAWQNRRGDVIKFLNQCDADIMGLQEVLHTQFEYLKKSLPSYRIIGDGREDGKTKGEYSPLLYKKDKYQLLRYETVWLSETPGIPSRGWDAALERIATFATLKSNKTGREFLVVNAHYDHRGEMARMESSKLISKKIIDGFRNYPVILMGDFNAEPESQPVLSFAENFSDTYLCKEKSGPDITFAGFTNLNYDQGPRIDYIFLDKFECLSFQIMTPKIRERNLSDHLPLVAVIQFQIQ